VDTLKQFHRQPIFAVAILETRDYLGFNGEVDRNALGADRIHDGNRKASTMTWNSDDETYLGDGLYARFDGYQFWLRAPRSDGDHEVALDPNTLYAFEKYVRHVKNTFEPSETQQGLVPIPDGYTEQ
jgi:hypothetical protein